MPRLVEPKVFLVGYTTGHRQGIEEYLKYTGQDEFLKDWDVAINRDGISQGEAICSMFAKLCYKSLIVGKNENVSKIRDIKNNIAGAYDSGHGSVFEHCNINFIVTDCSRVYTHEQVRHRQGWAYSQTSGRYCRADCIDLVLDPITEPVNKEIEVFVAALEQEYAQWVNRMGLNGLKGLYDALAKEKKPGQWKGPSYEELVTEAKRLGMQESKDKLYEVHPDTLKDWEHNFDRKKKITSALRRPLPNGQGNEIGMSVNIRALRHTIQLRTAGASEWEIRSIYNQVYDLVKDRFPMIFYRAKTRVRDGLREIYGMKTQPYEIEAGDPNALSFWEASALEVELAKRHGAA